MSEQETNTNSNTNAISQYTNQLVDAATTYAYANGIDWQALNDEQQEEVMQVLLEAFAYPMVDTLNDLSEDELKQVRMLVKSDFNTKLAESFQNVYSKIQNNGQLIAQSITNRLISA
jgi:hypothetical protein